MAIAKKRSTRTAVSNSNARVTKARTAKKAAKKTGTRNPATKAATPTKPAPKPAPKPHDVGAASDARAAALPRFKAEVTPTNGSHLRAYWTALEFELSHIKGETYPAKDWKLDTGKTGTSQYRKYWNSNAIYTRGHPSKFDTDGVNIRLNKTGLEFLVASCTGTGARATNPEMIDGFRTAIRTGKAPKGTAAAQYSFVAIK